MESTVKTEERQRYSPQELEEFRAIIMTKMDEAKRNLELLQAAVSGNPNEANDTAPTFKSMEEGSSVLSKESNAKLAARQRKFIKELEAALIRIANGTYGVCRVTGKLIPKERLRIVPHATTTVEGKLQDKRK